MDYFSEKPDGLLPTDPVHRSPLDSPVLTDEPEDLSEKKSELNSLGEKAASKSRESSVSSARKILSPSQLVPVLNQERSAAPLVLSRFLHGGPPLQDATGVAGLKASGSAAVVPASASWRPFTDDEQERLVAAWKQIEPSKRMLQADGKTVQDAEDNPVSDPDGEYQPHIVPVGLDSLFSVDLKNSILFPDFWSGAPVRVVLSTWFYAPKNPYGDTPSHLLKVYPIDPELSASLEKAFQETIRPWEDSYKAELGSALKVGPEAEAKLSVSIKVKGSVTPYEVIFQGKDWGRLYSATLMGSMGKSFLTSGKAHGGGQVVLRGWDAVRNWKREKQEPKRPGVTTENSGGSAIDDTEGSSATPQPRSRTTSSSTPTKPTALGSGFLAAIKAKMGVVAAAEEKEGVEVAADKKSGADTTEEAMAGPRNRGTERGGATGSQDFVGEVDELVLVVHGIGQQLSTTYESFNFVHAVNSLRTACTTQSISPSIAPLIKSKRAQMIPVRWRTDLDFESVVDEDADHEEEVLTNRFSLDDVEVKDSVPFLRQIVSGLVLDVPFYLAPAHKAMMLKAVVKDANRIYRLFCARNPGFAKNGKVSIIAHSLGSTLTADILSTQPTFVKPLAEMTSEEKRTEEHFIFDTRNFFAVGSPLAFFLKIGKGQLIARRGRERAKEAAPDIALDRPRYGCLAVDSLYNVYNESDPVAFNLNAAVDVKYARMIKPIAIPSTNVTLLQNLTDTYNRVTKLWNVAGLWSSGEAKSADVADAVEESSRKERTSDTGEEADEVKDLLTGPKREVKGVPRPGRLRRMPSEKPMPSEEFIRIDPLNPRGCLDYYLPVEGYSQYLEALTSHGSYWYDSRFATFILLSLFAAEEDLEKTRRDELGSDD
ncbi:hypothetical protein T439DRAFT_354980 [Meredithblackwellia eburnea MCA 4105]